VEARRALEKTSAIGLIYRGKEENVPALRFTFILLERQLQWTEETALAIRLPGR